MTADLHKHNIICKGKSDQILSLIQTVCWCPFSRGYLDAFMTWSRWIVFWLWLHSPAQPSVLFYPLPCLLAKACGIPISGMPPLPRGGLCKISGHSHQQGVLLKCRFGFNNSEWSLRLCTYNKLPGDANDVEVCRTNWVAWSQSTSSLRTWGRGWLCSPHPSGKYLETFYLSYLGGTNWHLVEKGHGYH